MKVDDEKAMIKLGERLAELVTAPALIELTGDVGAGKTTLVKGLARGLGVVDEVTSPSFTINKTYQFASSVLAKGEGTLSHYDFYRLEDAGIMKNEIIEVLTDPGAIVVVEWAGAVQDVLLTERIKINIAYNKDGSRTVTASGVEL
ncbi:MAG: tRNA (adenosine(37)-N6)-threonylcarbamoyltransferase complex ATPase subunit type 1 TsaE [Candidatus Nomurabacteria bacterium]|jgi:tRNA threonylcarbamoyladenosine biosynthesis protein TsaE|nr:tRNA (adenosine(37)-N6)-threonylcarbamoyltransferase complex ATPase subunit type 1 TsaE [Candidatus Nomurabacteria bacterium]